MIRLAPHTRPAAKPPLLRPFAEVEHERLQEVRLKDLKASIARRRFVENLTHKPRRLDQ